jgi:acetyltransferase-like isoleucine patch superfamily enzyme
MRLLEKVKRSLAKQAHLPASLILRNAVRSASAVAMAPLFLRRCNKVGSFARSFGKPRIDNRGRIEVGSHFAVNCAFVPVELRAEEGGVLTIGDGTGINYGTIVAAKGKIAIGNQVSIGPYCVVGAPDGEGDAARAPIEIGDGVWLAARVTVHPGARIGAHTVVSAGAVVTGDLPANAIVSGVPAKVLRIGSTGGAP